MRHEKRDNINFYNGDNMEFMKTKPDNYYDLAIVDPPYGIGASEMTMGSGKNKKWNKGKQWDNKTPEAIYWNELKRISKNQIIWGGNYFPLPLTKSWIFWDKNVPEGVSFADGELAWTSFDKTLVKAKIDYSGFRGMDNGGKIHPTQKPVKLYRWLLQNYAKQGMKILDTHGGSMTIARACDMEGYALDIIEIDEDYFNDGLKAFDNYKRQLTLF